jgi:hypothetical protein
LEVGEGEVDLLDGGFGGDERSDGLVVLRICDGGGDMLVADEAGELGVDSGGCAVFAG